MEEAETSLLEIVVGTYENFLLGFTVSGGPGQDSQEEDEVTEEHREYSLKPSFTNNSHCGSIRSICAVRKYIASGSTDEVIRLLNLSSRTEHGTLQHHTGTITCLTAFHSYLFSGSDDGSICIWKTGSWVCEKTLFAHEGGVMGVSVHPSGKLALSIGQDRALKTWNLIKGRHGYTTNIKGIADAVQWSTEGNYYAVSIANRLDVYSLESAKVVYTVPFGKKIWHIVFLTDNIVAVAGDSENVQVHDVSQSKQLTTFAAHKTRVKDMKYHVQQDLLITTSNSDGFIKLWRFPEAEFSKPPTLLTELNTTCRVTCLTVWDKSLVPSKKKKGEDETEDAHLILQEDEDTFEDRGDDGEEASDEAEMELEQPEPPKRKSKVKKSNTTEPTALDFREHKKSKRRKK